MVAMSVDIFADMTKRRIIVSTAGYSLENADTLGSLQMFSTEVPPLGEPIATCKGCQVRHANINITIPSATLFFLNAYTNGTGEDRTWHHLPTSEVRVEVMPRVMSAFQSDRN